MNEVHKDNFSDPAQRKELEKIREDLKIRLQLLSDMDERRSVDE